MGTVAQMSVIDNTLATRKRRCHYTHTNISLLVVLPWYIRSDGSARICFFRSLLVLSTRIGFYVNYARLCIRTWYLHTPTRAVVQCA